MPYPLQVNRRRWLGAVAAAVIAGSAAVAVAASPAAAVDGAGATVPFTSYEAEAGTLGGGASVVALTAAPTTQYSSPTLEASGHAYVQLISTGQSVQWTNGTGAPITALNLRASIPDSANGDGLTATLDLYVDNAFRQTLNLNSKQTWLYEGNNNYNGNSQNPANGNPRVFFDESRTFVTGAPIAPGSTFSLRRGASNNATFYYVDVIDAENPPPALAQPANSLSITSCGAVANNTPTNGAAAPGSTDSRAAIQSCIDQARTQNRVLWIPAGTFYVKGTSGLEAQGITIAGAGMWYSRIYRDVPLPNSVPLPALFNLTSCTVQNLSIESNATTRASIDGAGGAMDTTGTNWVADGIWTQHTLSGFWASGTGGTVRNSRLTAIWADGINLNNVSLNNSVGNNLTATNNFVRGTGDDGMAINSVNYNTDGNGNQTFYTPMSSITMTYNTIVAPWGGKGIGIYGGSNQRVEFNAVSDTARYIGLGAGRFGVNGNDLLSATVANNVVTRSGGNAYNQGQPALHIGNGGDGQNVGVVDHVTATNNTVVNALYDGIGFSTSTNTLLQNNTVASPWRNGITVAPPFYPAPSGSATITGNTVTGLSSGMAPFINNSGGFSATVSGNSWQGTGGPFGGTPAPVPGLVQAENYDTGGQGVGYSVTSVNGTANGYRTDGVDIETTSDAGGGYNVGWTSAGQWYRYTVNVAAAGTYMASLRVAAPGAVTGALHVSNAAGTNLTGAVNIPATGAWQNWTTVTTQLVLPAGQQVLTLVQDNSSVSASGDFQSTNTCPTLAANATCTVNVTFTPTASGTRTGTLTVISSAANSPTTVALSGTGAGSVNLAAGKPTSESSHTQVYASSNVTDGNQNIYWESANNAFPQWVQVDLGSAQSASRVVLQLPAPWGARDQTLSLLASTDGATFTTVKASATYPFAPTVNNTVTITFPATTQRYWRILVTSNTGWPAGQASEFQVWSQ